MSKKLVIGIGNRFRGDDALGPVVADELEKRGIRVIEHSGEPASLIDAWQGYDHVILVDAVFSGEEPGTTHHFDLSCQRLPVNFAKPTTHAVGVAEAVEFARVLNKLPPVIEFYGVEGLGYEHGAGLSAQVDAGMRTLIEKLAIGD